MLRHGELYTAQLDKGRIGNNVEAIPNHAELARLRDVRFLYAAYNDGREVIEMYLWRVGKDPVRQELERLRREMDGLVSIFSRGSSPWLTSPWRETRLLPRLNVRETTETFVVSSEIPGMKTENLEIKIEGDTLSIKGERIPSSLGNEVSCHRRERATGAFQRSLTLPMSVDGNEVTATYKNGVLTVTLLKKRATEPKRIQIAFD